jgi:GTP cyclohydrolase II
LLSRKRVSYRAAEPSVALLHVDRAVADLRRGGFVLLRHHEEGIALAATAETLTPEALARARALGSEPPALAITRRRAAVLGLAEPPTEPAGAVLVALAPEIGAEQIRDLADPAALSVVRGRSLAVTPVAKAGLAAAAVELAKLARVLPAVVLTPIRDDAARRLAEAEGIIELAAESVLGYQATAARTLHRVAEARVPLADAENARIIAYRPGDGGVEHLAILVGDPSPDEPVLTRLHSECFTGDLLGSLRCDCGDQLRGAIAEIARAGGGVLLYLAQEGRGIGLVNKLRAYQLQDAGYDTVDANEQLGFDADERVYLPAAEILRELRFSRTRLLTNNPEKVAALQRCGIAVVERVPHVIPANGHNEFYLHTKKTRSGHLL